MAFGTPGRRVAAPLLCISLFAAGCSSKEDEIPRRERLSVGGEVFGVFCMRSGAVAFPKDLEGSSFEPACYGTGAATASDPHFDALLARRDKIVTALDRVFAEDAALMAAAKGALTPFAKDEIRTFLGSLVPLYDAPDELMPESTRALAQVIGRLLDENDATGKKALDVLARTTGRVGYRPLRLALGVIRPVLEYPYLDDFINSTLALVSKGGKAEKDYDAVIHGLALELATYDPAPLAADASVIIARDLLLSPLAALDTPKPGATDGPVPLKLVKRDGRGVATPLKLGAPFVDDDADGLADIDNFGRLKPMEGGPSKIPAPYKVRDEAKSIVRGDDGIALNVWAGGATDEALFDSHEMQASMLAGLAREQIRLLKTVSGGRATFEKVQRGLPALLGPTTAHSKMYGKAKIDYEGPDFSKAPIIDLVHALSTVANKPDFLKVLKVVEGTMALDQEPVTAQLIDTLLKINERGKKHPEAQLVGADGPGKPHKFWDDMIAVGVRMTKRPGLIEAVMRSIMDDNAAGQGALIANWMRYSDVVPYQNAPSANPADFNTVVSSHTWTTPIDYTKPAVGANRSVFQKTMSLVHNMNGQKQCNKPDAHLKNVLGPISLPLLGPGYAPCELFQVNDMVEIHIQSVLGRAHIPLKPGDLNALGGLCPVIDATCLGKTQETKSEIVGFDDTPTPEALARFVFAPPNDFLSGITDPVPTRDGIPLKVWEPYALFPMEIVDPTAKPAGQPNSPGLNFFQAGYSLMQAFDDHELRDASGNLLDGYMFGHLLSTFHVHWDARNDDPCTGPPQETCTQRMDPKGKFFSNQTDIRSYEPLLAEALGDERLLEVLHDATKSLASITVDGEDGVTILARFVELMLTPDPNLTYRDGRTTAQNNLGEDVGYVSPIYLLLDGLKSIDKSFELAEHKKRHDTWKEARSELVDALLTIETGPDGKKRMEDRVGRAVSVRVVQFLQQRIQTHKDAGDLDAWAQSLAPRLADFLDRPVVGAALKLLDKTWDDGKAGAEFTKLTNYLFAEQIKDEKTGAMKEGPGFTSSVLAGGDLLQLLDDAASIAPLLALAAEAVGPGVTASVDTNGKSFSTETGLARRGVELQSAIAKIDTKRPSTTAKMLKNLVSDTMGDGSTPLEALLDSVAEVERTDPKQPNDSPLTRDDLKSVIGSIHHFVSDKEHGLERLYAIIQHRDRGKGE